MKKISVLIGIMLVAGFSFSGCNFAQQEETSPDTDQTMNGAMIGDDSMDADSPAEEDLMEKDDKMMEGEEETDLKEAAEEKITPESIQKLTEEKDDPFKDEMSLYKSIINSETINSNDCEKLKDDNLLSQCLNKAYSSEAIAAKDKTICEKIFDEQDREECISEVESLNSDKSTQ